MAVPAPAPSGGLLRSTPIHELPQSALPPKLIGDEPLEAHEEASSMHHDGSDELLYERVELFVKSYLGSFENKDFESLDTYFDDNAVEDGRPWVQLRREYRDRFENVETIRHEMIVRYIARGPDGLLTVKGDYHLRYDHKDGVRDSSTGTFEWSLRDTGTQLTLLKIRRERNGVGGTR